MMSEGRHETDAAEADIQGWIRNGLNDLNTPDDDVRGYEEQKLEDPAISNVCSNQHKVKIKQAKTVTLMVKLKEWTKFCLMMEEELLKGCWMTTALSFRYSSSQQSLTVKCPDFLKFQALKKSDGKGNESGTSPIIPYPRGFIPVANGKSLDDRGVSPFSFNGPSQPSSNCVTFALQGALIPTARCAHAHTPGDKLSTDGESQEISDTSSDVADEARNARNLFGYCPVKDGRMKYHTVSSTEDGIVTEGVSFLSTSPSVVDDAESGVKPECTDEGSQDVSCTTSQSDVAKEARDTWNVVCQVYPKDTRMQCPKMSLAVANEAEAAKCFRSTVSHVHSSDDIEDECRATQCASDANDVICTLIDRGEQWNVEKRVAALSQTEALCMQSKPVPEELRRAMVIGCDLNRKWLTVFSQSNFVIAAYEGAACHEDDGDKDSDEENSKEKKRKAMDRIRRENEEKRLRQNAANMNKGLDPGNHSPRNNSASVRSDLKNISSDQSYGQQGVKRGQVLMSNVNSVFREGSFVPLPSQEAMAKTIGSGGNGVVAFIYHGGREFAVKETGLRQEELETWSSVSHPNVIEISAVIEGEWDSLYPGARTCYQMMPRVTGDIKSILEERGMPTLCHYFYDFKEDSERAGLVLGNAKYILLGVLNGLKHLHSLGIMHRDIKLQNILVDRHCQCKDLFLCQHYGESGYGVFISDFDSTLRVDRGREKLERSKLHHHPIKYSVHGTLGYRPPETSFSMSCNKVLPEWISLKTDIWSFGTMLVKLFVGSRGPSSQREIATLLLADCLQSSAAVKRPDRVETSPLRQALAVEPNEMKRLQKVALLEKYFPQATELHQLAQACLTVGWQDRPSVEDVMAMGFFKTVKDSSGKPVSSMPAGDRERVAGGFQTTSGMVTRSNGGESQK